MPSEGGRTVSSRVNARIGLLGNPSDSFEGCCIAAAIENFAATVTLEEAEGVHCMPHPDHDPTGFADLDALANHVDRHGYYGGQRLLQATCKRFQAACAARGLVPSGPGFRMTYETNIPRQSGLSGSSAIVCAAFNCLLQWYGVEEHWPPVQRPRFVLEVETEELGITAGLMDRVAQVYGGAVYLDLRAASMRDGHGQYEYLPADALPTLWLMYANNPSDSGRTHAPVKQRWRDGEEEVRQGMRDLADLANIGREQLRAADAFVSAAEFGSLMEQNFALRRRLYGDAALGALNLEMVETARSVGACAKFCGSGGAIVVCCPGGEGQVAKLMEACMENHFVCEKVHVAKQLFSSIS